MTPHPNVLVIQNTRTGTSSRLGDWLHDDGLRLDVALAFDGSPLPEQLEHDAVLVLGGGYLPDDDERAPWLPQTRSLVSQALELNRPVLGICLGGQLLAHVAGGTVEGDTGTPEQGSTQISMRTAARTDPLFSELPGEVNAMEHHFDAITALPPDATWLASSDRCPYQAFRVGEFAWGVQFHPEMTADRILGWDAEKLQRRGIDRQTLYEEALANESNSTQLWRSFAGKFAMMVHGQTRTR